MTPSPLNHRKHTGASTPQQNQPPRKRCAIYTRKSREEGLDQAFNSLESQRDYAEKYIASQASQGWEVIPTAYDDGGVSGGTLERPALQRLLADLQQGEIDCIVVYKIDRLSRSLLDFTRLVELFDHYRVEFVSVTESFNTSTAMGRLMLGVVMGFAQYERELASERVRDKIAASRKKGLWTGGRLPLGYVARDGQLIVEPDEAATVRQLFRRFVQIGSITHLMQELHETGITNKQHVSTQGNPTGGKPFNKKTLRRLLTHPIYRGQMVHKGNCYAGQHTALIDEGLWQQVQAVFHRREQQKTREQSERQERDSRALLKGLLHCQACDCAMTPSWSQRKNRRYYYYVCSNHLRKKNCQAIHHSVSAGEVEGFVVGQVRALLHSPEIRAQASRLLEQTGLSASQSLALLRDMEAVWSHLFPLEQQRIVQLLVRVIYLSDEGIEVRIRESHLRQLCADLEAAEFSNGGHGEAKTTATGELGTLP